MKILLCTSPNRHSDTSSTRMGKHLYLIFGCSSFLSFLFWLIIKTMWGFTFLCRNINKYCQVLLHFTVQLKWIFPHRIIFAKQCHVISKEINLCKNCFECYWFRNRRTKNLPVCFRKITHNEYQRKQKKWLASYFFQSSTCMCICIIIFTLSSVVDLKWF